MNRICEVEGCGRPAKSLRHCAPHYERAKKHGHPQVDILINSRWRGIEFLRGLIGTTEGGCIPFPFNAGADGYGTAILEGVAMRASRAMCILANGPPPYSGAEAAHSCGNGHDGCVNPNHLRWRTKAQNAAEAVAHGDFHSGESNKASKLSREDVDQILSLKGKENQYITAARFGIDQSNVSRIQCGKAWVCGPDFNDGGFPQGDDE